MRARSLALPLFIVLLVVLAGLSRVPQAAAQPPLPSDTNLPLGEYPNENLALVGQIGGSANAIAVEGDYAYLGIGPRLVSISLSNPDQPLLVGQSEVLSSTIRDIAIVGSYAYASAGPAGLYVFNVTDPAAPVEIGAETSGDAYRMVVRGHYAFIVGNGLDGSGLRIVDISDPTAPQQVGFYGGAEARDVAVVGNYAYVVDVVSCYRHCDYGSLHILDVSDPSDPQPTAVYDTIGYTFTVAADEQYAYVTTHWGLEIVDVSDPATPAQVGGVIRGASLNVLRSFRMIISTLQG